MIDQYRYIPLEIDDFRALSMWKYKPTSVIILVSSTYERRALPHKFTRQVSIYAHKSSESLLPPFFIYPQRPSPLLGHSPSGLVLTRPDSLALAGVFTGHDAWKAREGPARNVSSKRSLYALVFAHGPHRT